MPGALNEWIWKFFFIKQKRPPDNANANGALSANDKRHLMWEKPTAFTNFNCHQVFGDRFIFVYFVNETKEKTYAFIQRGSDGRMVGHMVATANCNCEFHSWQFAFIHTSHSVSSTMFYASRKTMTVFIRGNKTKWSNSRYDAVEAKLNVHTLVLALLCSKDDTHSRFYSLQYWRRCRDWSSKTIAMQFDLFFADALSSQFYFTHSHDMNRRGDWWVHRARIDRLESFRASNLRNYF